MADSGVAQVIREEDAPAASGLHARPRGLSSAIPSTFTRSIPAWIVLVLLVVVGGTGGLSTALIGGANLGEDVDALREDQQQLEARLTESERRDDAHATSIADLEASAQATEIRLLREQRIQTRWMIDTLIKQSTALEAIAEKLHVEVDVRVPLYPQFDEVPP